MVLLIKTKNASGKDAIMSRNTNNSTAKNEIAGPKGSVKNGLNINHGQTIVRDQMQAGPRAGVKSGITTNHNQTIVRG